MLGTTMGSPEDFSSLMTFVAAHKITPVVDKVFPLAEADAAFRRMASGEQFGKIALSLTAKRESTAPTPAVTPSRPPREK
jgi:D-arabinose 1-dehydrogenase-like Zn-dependent alcohol dehydrogenase